MGIAGTWYNELGSRMNLVVNGHSITGTYTTAVGRAKGDYPLYGAAVPAAGASQALGFVVAWANQSGTADSVTSWSGQYQVIAGQEETIIATWLLTMETSPGADWRSTLVGHDTFGRTAPSPDQVEAHARRRPWSHPFS